MYLQNKYILSLIKLFNAVPRLPNEFDTRGIFSPALARLATELVKDITELCTVGVSESAVIN